jgi:hypothetical protein
MIIHLHRIISSSFLPSNVTRAGLHEDGSCEYTLPLRLNEQAQRTLRAANFEDQIAGLMKERGGARGDERLK